MMLAIKLVVFGICAFSVSGKLPTFENPKTYTYKVDKQYDPFDPPNQNYEDTEPVGFIRAVLPHPPNAGRPNPVYELRGLEWRQIEIRVETLQPGAGICVRDNEEGPDLCTQGSMNQCYMASKDTLRFEFYCMESCQSSDINFFFRIVASKQGANDMWCMNRLPNGYPSDLIEGPDLARINKPKPTPPPPQEGSSNARTVTPIITLLISLLLISILL